MMLKTFSSRVTCPSVWRRCSWKPDFNGVLVAASAILGRALVSRCSAS